MKTGNRSLEDYFVPQVEESSRFKRGGASSRGGLVVVLGGRERCAADYKVKRAGFPYYCLELVAAGTGRMELAGHRHLLKPGTVFTYGPGVPHTLVSDVQRRMVKYFVDFQGPRAASLLHSAGLAPGTCIRLNDAGPAVDVFNDLVATGRTDDAMTSRMCALLLELLILRCAASRSDGPGQSPQALATFQRCRDLATREFTHIRDAGSLAQAVGLDVAYVCRLFRRFAGQTPSRYLMQLRLREAARRLRGSGCLVKQVAADLGFADPFHFSRSFKRQYGVPPDQFAR